MKSPVREFRSPGSVRGTLGNWRSYRDDEIQLIVKCLEHHLFG